MAMLRDDNKFTWSKHSKNDFYELMTKPSTPPVLALQTMEGDDILDTDALDNIMGGVLSLVQEGRRE